MKKIKTGILFGGNSPEHEISIMSARSVIQNIDSDKYESIPLGISKNGYWLEPNASRKVIDNDLKQINDNAGKGKIEKNNKEKKESLIPFLQEELDIVFPLLHGPNGEDGKVQGFLEMIDMPYVGTGVVGSALGMDKAYTKRIFTNNNLPQGAYYILRKDEWENNKKEIKEKIIDIFSIPCFIKPANMGSSIGISKIKDINELKEALHKAFAYDNKIVIEEFIVGRELECSVLGINKFRASLPGEIIPGNDFYDYDAKYKNQSTELKIPVSLEKPIIEQIQKLAIKVFKAIEGEGLARVDFFLNADNNLLINEINTIPGFTEYSMYPKLWEVSGIPYSELIDKLIMMTLNNYR